MAEKIVAPGDFLILEEEFLGGRNTFTDEEGNIFSDSLGKVIFDKDSRTVNVEKQHTVSNLAVSSIVFAEVISVKDNVLTVKMRCPEDSNQKLVISPTFAVIRVANVSRDYIKSLRDAFKIGDLVKARVCEIELFGIQLRTNEHDLGVVKAYCGKCRAPLRLFGSALKCLNCGNTEQRKFSTEYSLK